MVAPLKVGKFYGSKLPRPRIYANPKFNTARVDPPVSVNDALLNWAKDAHWSMGGLSFKRMRMQGKIEGSVRRLRAEKEKSSRRRKTVEIDQKIYDSSPDQTPKETPLKHKQEKSQGIGEVTPQEMEEVPKFVPETREKSLPPYSRTRSAKAAVLKTSPVLPLLEAAASKSVAGRKSAASSRSTTSNKLATKGSNRSNSPKKGAVRRVLLLKEDSSDSDDGLETFLKDKNRPLRRSSRLQSAVKSPKGSELAARHSDSDPE